MMRLVWRGRGVATVEGRISSKPGGPCNGRGVVVWPSPKAHSVGCRLGGVLPLLTFQNDGPTLAAIESTEPATLAVTSW